MIKSNQEHQAKRATRRSQSHTLLSFSKALITNDLNTIMALGEDFDALNVNVSVEGLNSIEGDGWGCIYSHQSLPSRCHLSATCGRSTCLVWTVAPARSTVGSQWMVITAISTIIIMLNASSDVS
jgi:hypothetical protein